MLPALRRNVPAPWREPFEPLEREIAHWFSDWPELSAASSSLVGAYPVDIREDDDRIYVDAEMPGFAKDDIDVTLDDGTLSISAERRVEEKEGKEHLRERRYTKVQRRFTLPTTVDESSVDAKLEDGVLHLEMKKSGEPKGRRIKVA